MPKKIRHEYAPRPLFMPFHERVQRWAIEVVHRRGGKTVAAVNDTIARIFTFRPPEHLINPPPGRFAYVAPFYNQAKQVAWAYAKQYSGAASIKSSEGELSITYFNNAKLTLYGADNPDAFRGLYFDGVVLDEFGMMRPSTWSEVILPTLVDRGGWATFIGTPNGPNHFRDLYYAAIADRDRWFVEKHPVSETKLIPDEELEEMRRLMLPEEYEQEMECSFEASTRGAFYVQEMGEAEKDGRVCELVADPEMPLHFIFDLGFTDDTAMIAFHDAADGYPIIHTEAEHYRPIAYYMARMEHICKELGCKRGEVWLPHDARAKTLQTGRSIVEQFVAAGIRPRLIPKLDIMDGIASARLLFPHIYFNITRTKELILALKSYRREYDEDKKAFRAKPVHDWSSHYADVFRYFCLIAKKDLLPASPAPRQPIGNKQGNNYNFSLEDLFTERSSNVRNLEEWI